MADQPPMMMRLFFWARRNMPVWYALAGCAVFGVLVLIWYAVGPGSVAWMWGATHGHAATLGKASVKLPRGWREHNSVGRADLHLERPFKWHARTDTVDVDELNGAAADFQRMLNTLNSLEKMAIKEGDVAAVYPLSDANAARFVCMEHGSKDEEAVHVTCLERDGRRVVRMNGYEDSRQDFAAILSSIAVPAP
jgi:hypothetical protein